jgi:hypothetical protein
MKKRILLSGVMWCLTSIPGHACYVIQTKGSGEFQTTGYWKEGGEIRFSMANGVMGLAESEILKITMVNHDQRPIDCRWADETPADLVESDEESPRPAGAADLSPVVTARAGAATTKSEALQQFENGVSALEVQLRRIGTMSGEELLDLAKTAEALKKEMVAANEGNALNPLLLKVYAGLEQIESMMGP